MAKTKERLGIAEVMAELKANGSAQTRETYRNAGIKGEMIGISYAFMKKLHKRVKMDHELALALWETGLLDARTLACWVADSEKTTVKLLETWARDERGMRVEFQVDKDANDHTLLGDQCDQTSLLATRVATQDIQAKDAAHELRPQAAMGRAPGGT